MTFNTSSTIREIHAKSILRKRKRVDPWFISCYGMNLYRGCLHNCVYCDGRAEKYQVEGVFGKTLDVKINALEILKRELDPTRRRIPLKPCYMFLGGGVGDAYQPAEEKYQLARGALELFDQFDWPVHILTKSVLVKRDLDLIQKVNSKKRAIVSMSFSSVDPDLCALFEPGVPSPQERLETLKSYKKAGIPCGMFLMPVIPFITDSVEQLRKTVQAAKDANLDFIVFGGMTLKQGRQKAHFLKCIERHYPDKLWKYQKLYQHNPYETGTETYYHALNERFYKIVRNLKIPLRIPPTLFGDLLDIQDLIVVIFEQIDYLLKLRGEKSSYGYAAYQVSQLEDIDQIKSGKLKTMSSEIINEIHEIAETGSSPLLNEMI